MIKYLILGYEQTDRLPTNACVVGTHRTLKAAQRNLKKLKREELKKYDDEFVGHEDPIIVIFKSRRDTFFTYSLVISKQEI